jgi:hypothetical protein
VGWKIDPFGNKKTLIKKCFPAKPVEEEWGLLFLQT